MYMQLKERRDKTLSKGKIVRIVPYFPFKTVLSTKAITNNETKTEFPA